MLKLWATNAPRAAPANVTAPRIRPTFQSIRTRKAITAVATRADNRLGAFRHRNGFDKCDPEECDQGRREQGDVAAAEEPAIEAEGMVDP